MYSDLFNSTVIIGVLILWVLHNLATIKVARRLNFETVWPVWIPFAGKFYVYAKMAGMSGWTVLLCFIPLVNYITGTIIIMVWIWNIAKRLDRSGWPGLIFGTGMIFFWALESDERFRKRMVAQKKSKVH